MVADITHPDDLEATWLAVRKSMDDRPNDPIEFEKRYVRKNGDIVWAHTTAAWIFGVDKKPAYRVSVILDITESKQAEEEIRFQNALLKCQGETSPDGILVVDEDGKMISFNQRFVDMWGVPEQVLD